MSDKMFVGVSVTIKDGRFFFDIMADKGLSLACWMRQVWQSSCLRALAMHVSVYGIIQIAQTRALKKKEIGWNENLNKGESNEQAQETYDSLGNHINDCFGNHC